MQHAALDRQARRSTRLAASAVLADTVSLRARARQQPQQGPQAVEQPDQRGQPQRAGQGEHGRGDGHRPRPGRRRQPVAAAPSRDSSTAISATSSSSSERSSSALVGAGTPDSGQAVSPPCGPREPAAD